MSIICIENVKEFYTYEFCPCVSYRKLDTLRFMIIKFHCAVS